MHIAAHMSELWRMSHSSPAAGAQQCAGCKRCAPAAIIAHLPSGLGRHREAPLHLGTRPRQTKQRTSKCTPFAVRTHPSRSVAYPSTKTMSPTVYLAPPALQYRDATPNLPIKALLYNYPKTTLRKQWQTTCGAF